MVRRSDRASGEVVRKKGAGGAQGRLQRRQHRKGGKRGIDEDDDMLEVQRPGALSLNNPLIPPDLDEDIDDDLAFNSDDEEKYGHFFNKKTKPDSTADSTGGKKKKKKSAKERGGNAADMGDSEDALVLQQLRALGEIEDDEDLDFHERDSAGDDDDDYIDLADMLDAAEDGVDGKGGADSSGKKKKKKKKLDEDGVAKKRRRARVTEEAESIYGPAAVEGSYSSNIRQVVAATPLPSTQARVQQSLENKHNLISIDVDDTKKETLVRGEVRKVVAEDLAKYETFLREQQNSKHVQLPMPMPESNPVPSTLGAIAAAAEAQFAHQKDGNIAETLDTEKIGNNATRASAFRLAGKMNALLSGAGLLRPQLTSGNAEDGVVPLDDDNENNNGMAGTSKRNDDGSVPTTSYMAKLKAMLSYENARRRRLNRIKSKTYRRILRKEKEREKERREKAFEILHPEKARARLAEKLMKARMEERVTQKHKNTSKWVRHAKRFAQFDDNTKDALNEQHMLHQQLMRKMEEDANEDEYLNADGDGRANSEAASSEEERVVDYLIAEAKGEQSAGNAKKNLTSVLWNSVDDDKKGKGSGGAGVSDMTPTEKARLELRGMKFMQQAREREEKCYAEVLEQLQEDIRRDMRGETLDSDDEVPDLDDNSGKVNKKKGKAGSSSTTLTASGGQTIGRKVFQQQNDRNNGIKGVENIQLKQQSGIDAHAHQEEEDDDDDDDEVLSASGSDKEKDCSYSINEDNDSEEEKEKKPEPTKVKKTKKNRESKDEFAGIRKPNKVSGSLKGSGVAAPSSSTPIISSVSTPSSEKNSSSTRITILPGVSKRPRRDEDLDGTAVIASDHTEKNEYEDDEEGKEQQQQGQEPHEDDEMTLQQQQEYLIARAFAGDEVDAEFLAQKAAQVETIMRPVDKNASLPGWGEWGGADARLNTRHQAKIQAMQMQREIERTTLLKSRADAALDHVIINHDGVELVPDRMLLHMIPRPFSNPTEFARSMRHPHGPEWNTALTFKEANQPRVEVRQGHAVLPLDLSLRTKKKMKTKRRKTEATA
ncbi:U3 small nucleolar RNA-associated protein 14 [Trypanosoma theileri]|uniref:U3 small nucleolar RNA-associated protein 14 n=1 Tax=Trypanosoma theileri TaxID=67003 RepID=A0A1X0P829_9TRYP|nr:U3 small nucleolar RNA-associated protein 14 [Trypanosoma theileri]ORC92570.1 U3 small nucleolar RNA-associated protein 14 [Trypanosoma theileri]